MSELRGFLTGSNAYGVTGENSDVDIVVLLTPEASNFLASVADMSRQGSSGEFIDSVSYRFGKLDLIVCEDPAFFAEVWKAGTDELIARKSVTRDEAVELFKKKMADFWERNNAEESQAIVSALEEASP